MPAGYTTYMFGGWKTLAVLAGYALALVALTVRGGLFLVIAGGGLLGEVGGLTALVAKPELPIVLLPGIYSLASVSTAAMRVVGGKRPLLAGALSSLLAVALAIVIAYRGGCLACLVLAGDVLARFAIVAFGPGRRLGVRTYGFLEAIHSPIILGLLALLLG